MLKGAALTWQFETLVAVTNVVPVAFDASSFICKLVVQVVAYVQQAGLQRQ